MKVGPKVGATERDSVKLIGQLGQVKLNKVNAFSVVDRSGMILTIETTIVKANDARAEHPGSRMQMDQYDEAQLAELMREQARRESYRPPPSEPVSETRIRSLTMIDNYDPLTMLNQEEVDLLVERRNRQLKLERFKTLG